MSDLRIALIAEGATDAEVIRAALSVHLSRARSTGSKPFSKAGSALRSSEEKPCSVCRRSHQKPGLPQPCFRPYINPGMASNASRTWKPDCLVSLNICVSKRHNGTIAARHRTLQIIWKP